MQVHRGLSGPTVVLEEIEIFCLLSILENRPRDRAMIEALYGTGAESTSTCN